MIDALLDIDTIQNSNDLAAMRAHVIASGGDVSRFDSLSDAAGIRGARCVAIACAASYLRPCREEMFAGVAETYAAIMGRAA